MDFPNFLKRKYILNIPQTGEEYLDLLLPPRATGSASSAAYEALCLSSWGGTIFMAHMKQGPSKTTVRAINIHVRYHNMTRMKKIVS